MAELKVHLPDTLEQLFRRTAMAIYGYGRGSLSKAAAEALTEWCNRHTPSQSPQELANPKEERILEQTTDKSKVEQPPGQVIQAGPSSEVEQDSPKQERIKAEG